MNDLTYQVAQHAGSASSGTPLAEAKLYGNETIATPIGPIELIHSYFDEEASTRLFDEMDFQRACQAYIWSTPLVSISPDCCTAVNG